MSLPIVLRGYVHCAPVLERTASQTAPPGWQSLGKGTHVTRSPRTAHTHCRPAPLDTNSLVEDSFATSSPHIGHVESQTPCCYHCLVEGTGPLQTGRAGSRAAPPAYRAVVRGTSLTCFPRTGQVHSQTAPPRFHSASMMESSSGMQNREVRNRASQPRYHSLSMTE